MKEQYVGDANDYRKYALLRALSGDGSVPIGVVWMLTPSDGGPDGNKLGYLSQPSHRPHDPELFDTLAAALQAPDKRRLAVIEESGIISGAAYFNDPIGDGVLERRHFMAKALQELAHCELLFFDPDNGLDVPSRGKGGKGSSKYLYRDELVAAFHAGHSLLVYQHFPRTERTAFVHRLGTELGELCDRARVFAYLTPHVVFFLVLNARHHVRLGQLAAQAMDRWPASFLAGHEVP